MLIATKIHVTLNHVHNVFKFNSMFPHRLLFMNGSCSVALCHCNTAISTHLAFACGFWGTYSHILTAGLSLKKHPYGSQSRVWTPKNTNTRNVKCQHEFFSWCNRVPVVGRRIMGARACVCVGGGGVSKNMKFYEDRGATIWRPKPERKAWH
jgi:hypothetical protein